MSIILNENRIGRFTSSEIVALTKVKANGSFMSAALTYIEETNLERRLGRSLTDESNARPLLWGTLLEDICFNRLGLEYTLCSQETIKHPRIDYWAGSADGIKHNEGKTVIDIKAPYTLKSFCQLVAPIYESLEGMEAINHIRKNHKDGDKYYWQLLSNSILNETQHCELVVYMPYHSELEEIRNSIVGDGRYSFIYYALENELPFIPDNGYYKNINKITFTPPAEDKQFLYDCVLKAGEMLIKI